MLRIAMGDRVLSTPFSREENGVYSLPDDEPIVAAPHVTTEDAATYTDVDDPELKVLEARFGELTRGKAIELPLRELLLLIPRSRKRSDAYRSLLTKLNGIGVTLTITTKTKSL